MRFLSDFKKRIRETSSFWPVASIFCLAAFAVRIWIDKDCGFVRLTGTVEYPDGTTGLTNETFYRGTQRGKLLPGDSCTAWAQYDDLELDRNMVITRASAALTIVLGSFVMAFLLFFPFSIRLCVRRTIKWTGAIFALSCTVFQALTHLMVKSDLCERSTLTSTDSHGNTIIWDQCSKKTPTYNATFFTMAAWAVAAISMALVSYSLPDTTIKASQEDRDDAKDAPAEEV